MKTNYIFCLFLLCIFTTPTALFAQNCNNVDFEEATFNGWSAFTGYNPGGGLPAPVTTPGIVSGRHTILSSAGIDPHSNGMLPLLSPFGGSHSVRLGDDNVGSEAEKLTKTILITPQNTSLVYEYAVVFEDPGHPQEDQPRFELNILDQNGNVIADPCFNYSVTAASNLPGFFQGPEDVVFRVWTPVALDLSAYVGQNITIEFTTYDCAYGGHFGYAYFDARCTRLQIIKSNCDSNQVIISVPPGFVSYLWNTGDTTQSIILNNPPIGAEYSVTATSETGCNTTLSIEIVADTVPQPQLELVPLFCDDGSSVTLYAPYGFNTFLWSTGDTTNYTTVVGPQVGDSIYVQLSNGIYCPVVVSYLIDSLPNANPNPIIEYITICENADSALIFGPQGYASYQWATGETTTNIVIDNPQINDTISVFAFPGAGCPAYYQYIIASITNGSSTQYIQEYVCDGANSVFLNAGEGYTNYQWSTGQTSSNISYQQPQFGDTASCTFYDYNGCIYNTYFVFMEDQSVGDTTYNTINACAEIQVYNIQAQGGYINYLWSNNTQGYQTTIQYPQTGQNVYVQMTAQNGCKAYAGYTFNLADNFPDNLEVTVGQFCITTKQVNLTAPGGYSAYFWSTGDFGPVTVITEPQAGDDYYVIMHDNNGCKDTVFITLSYNNLPVNMIVDDNPNFFTPNYDNLNEDFGIEADDYQLYDLRIFNRWGTEVFNSDTENKRWNGKVNGQPAPEGVYYYVFKVKACGNGKLVERKGSVTLLRDAK